MGDRDRYLNALAMKVSNWCEKPSALITAMAFLFVLTFSASLIEFSVAGHFLASMAICMVILLMVLLLQNAHKQDIHALQARLDAAVAQWNARERAAGDQLSAAELQDIRDIIQQRADGDDAFRGSNRDKRPSLF